tara:strand:+ start:6262 stop:7656 length:1395 start_codon:yes stop_codon:yes gene_type:complete
MEAKWWLEESHPYRETPKAPQIYILSADYRTLRKGVWRHLRNFLYEWEIESQGPSLYGKGEVPIWLRMKNGAQVEFISGDGGEDARKKCQAAACDLIIVDEEIPGVLWDELTARRLAGTTGRGGEIVVAATMVRSEPWIVELEERADRGDPNVEHFCLKTSRAVERGHVSKDVFEEMDTHLSEEERFVRLEGGSRKRQGLVYSEFNRKHIVDEPFEIPSNWTRYCSIDPGFRTCAALWGAVSPDGMTFIYRECYLHAKTYHTLAEFIMEAEGYKYDEEHGNWHLTENSETIKVRWIDPAGFQHSVSGEVGVGAMLASEYGIFCSPARNSVVVGIEKVKQALMLDMSGKPRLRVFRNCPNLIREFQSYRWVEDRGGRGHERRDGPVKRNDHALDALRYMAHGGFEHHSEVDTAREVLHAMEMERGKHGTGKLPERMENWWRKQALKQRYGKDYQARHVGGIGSVW